LFLSACAINQSNAVPDEESAKKIAIRECHWDKPVGSYERWHAALHQGVWHVWLSIEPGVQEEPKPGFLDIWIRASDGKWDDCVMAVE
jgi:hypothetical protein